MKLFKNSILLVCVLALAVACKEKPKASYSSVKLDEFFELKMNQSVVILDNDLKLTFTGVPEESRCPRFTNCIQEGQVRVTLEAVHAGKSKLIEFTRTPSETSNSTVALEKFKIQLYDVTPFPESGKKINLTDYGARMAVRKVN